MVNETTGNPMIVLLGPTACGKTKLAVQLAAALNGEILSADSRQVYKGMDVGTGKDLAEYTLGNQVIPYHLIDIVEAGYKYNVYEFQRDFLVVWEEMVKRGKQPVLCGGTGLYLEAVLKGYRLFPVPPNPALRQTLEQKPLAELTELLAGYKQLHNTTDVDSVKRAVRALEIEQFYADNEASANSFPTIPSVVFGLNIDREERRKRISDRLRARLQEGLVEEVQGLLDRGISADDLIYYGLEYKYVSLYLLKKLTYIELVSQLEIAIHQFAKRQMTWFRGMERRGIRINWLEAQKDPQENTALILTILNQVG
jgi:tRNA dimethylallyltransferase